MARKGLTKEIILEEALDQVIEKGYENLSLRDLASRLGVKPASLYNHISGINELDEYIVMHASEKLHQELTCAIGDKKANSDAAFRAACLSYRNFAVNNPEVYKALIKAPGSADDKIVEYGFKSFEPFRNLIMSYDADKKEIVCYIRMLRAFLHGFLNLGDAGFFMKHGIDSREQTYEWAVEHYLQILKNLKRK